jgi:hypothetical protein
MNHREATEIEYRLKVYRALEKREEELLTAIEQITTNRTDDPNQTGPFTGNTRETRRIDSIHIGFTATLGRSPPVEMEIFNLGIEARLFGQALLVLLREKLEEVRNEMEKA